MVKTHANFTSFVESVKDAETMHALVGEALDFDLDVKIPLWEVNNWGRGVVENFKIELEKIDRLYYIDKQLVSNWEQMYYLVCRMNYCGMVVFIELRASHRFNDHKSGIVLMSANVNHFIESIISDDCPMNSIRQSLACDGIQISNYLYDYEKYYRAIIRGDSPFDKSISTNNHIVYTIPYYRKFLPQFLQNNLSDFLDFAENKEFIGDTQ